jgi:hypothetical protein
MNKFRLYSKFALLLVVFGFFMPVACNQNGFELAEILVKGDNSLFLGILMYVLFVAAVLGVIIGIMLLMKKKVNVAYDWITILVSIGSGLIVYFRLFEKAKDALQTGAWVILIGWIVALVFMLIPSKRR